MNLQDVFLPNHRDGIPRHARQGHTNKATSIMDVKHLKVTQERILRSWKEHSWECFSSFHHSSLPKH